MREQLHIFLNAIMFYTRIPIPVKMDYSPALMGRTTRYFPLVGWIVGGIGAAIFYGLQFVLPLSLAVLLSMVATIFVTGAFHEDGFADFCDGFGGGYNRDRILSIMKDSRLGTYGSIGMTGMLAVKLLSLMNLPAQQIPFALLAAHGLSRLMPVLVMSCSDYARNDDSSKAKPVGKRLKTSDLFIAIVLGLIPAYLLPLSFLAVLLPSLLLVSFLFRAYLIRRIGGYTGDCMGALQQIAEVVIYLGFVIFQTLAA